MPFEQDDFGYRCLWKGVWWCPFADGLTSQCVSGWPAVKFCPAGKACIDYRVSDWPVEESALYTFRTSGIRYL